MGFRDRIAHAWNAFTDVDRDEERKHPYSWAESQLSMRPDRPRLFNAGDKGIISAIYNRMAIDFASENMLHVRQDENRRYKETINSPLNDCLTTEANLDQGSRAFKQDIAMSLFDKGSIAIVAVDTTLDPTVSGSFDVKTLRVGEVVAWYPRTVKVRLYNDRTGKKQEIILPKQVVAIVENPLYTVMNEPNSNLQRLIRKLQLLDNVDDQASSGKLDIIIQLPYQLKTEMKKNQADERLKDIQMQLKGSQYGIAYTDAGEKITQLNRPAENNMLKQIEYLTGLLYGQLGLTEGVFNGTASEAEMLNYYNRTIEPLLAAVSQAMMRAFLTKTARSQGQAISYFRDPFKLVPITTIAEIADKFTRNEIMSSNEIRSLLGMRPSDDPKADQLRNSNMPVRDTEQAALPQGEYEATPLAQSALTQVRARQLTERVLQNGS